MEIKKKQDINVDNQIAAYTIRGVISTLPQDSQDKVKQAYLGMQNIIKDNGDEGYIALALLGAELAAEK